ncbi:ribosomal protein L34-domain-containing protein [Gigaspora margarita]|uniref:Ribosomal protein L34-domain-containing protein n=1 Tax=Gigaspora margarita TaxID=4874 RepID=A0A8H4AQT9_GIGMA|nr:ribosomal protein L34-domain-containing protein [Gigaspora margarita]
MVLSFIRVLPVFHRFVGVSPLRQNFAVLPGFHNFAEVFSGLRIQLQSPIPTSTLWSSQVRFKAYGREYQPSNLIRKRRNGFLASLKYFLYKDDIVYEN